MPRLLHHISARYHPKVQLGRNSQALASILKDSGGDMARIESYPSGRDPFANLLHVEGAFLAQKPRHPTEEIRAGRQFQFERSRDLGFLVEGESLD